MTWESVLMLMSGAVVLPRHRLLQGKEGERCGWWGMRGGGSGWRAWSLGVPEKLFFIGEAHMHAGRYAVVCALAAAGCSSCVARIRCCA